MLKFNEFTQLVENRFSENPFTQVYALGRSLIAIGTLSVLIFNNLDYLFDQDSLDTISKSKFLFNKINLFGILGYSNLFWSKCLSVFILLLVLSGYLPKITGILHFWVVYSFHNSALLLDGGDQIATIFTFLLIPITLFDGRINHWLPPCRQSPISKIIGLLTFLGISLQTAFIYLNTAVEKIYMLEDWKNGTAIYYIFNNSYFGVSDKLNSFFSLLIDTKVVFFMTWWIIASHLLLSYLLFLRRNYKKNFVWVGLSLHIGIALFIGLYSFSIIMLGVLILYALPFNYLKIKKSWSTRKIKNFTF